jgi:hypothetical protein
LESAAKYGNPALNHRHLSNFRALQEYTPDINPIYIQKKGPKKNAFIKQKILMPGASGVFNGQQ